MLLQNIRAKLGARLSGESESGFTLIELLVVMLILGILAAIALPAFFNQKDKAGDAKAKENLHTAQVAMETFSTEHGGSYEGAEISDLKNIEPSLNSAPFVEGATNFEAGEKSYKITMEGSSATQKFWITRETSGELLFECEEPGTGGCPPGATEAATTSSWENG
jgi:type IV pilus assembly protein PilA